MEHNNESLRFAVQLYLSDQKLATETYGPIEEWDVSNVTDMSSIFANAQKFNQDISQWNVSNVTDMNGMFNNAQKFNQDISQWLVSNVTDMSDMFCNAYKFNQNMVKGYGKRYISQLHKDLKDRPEELKLRMSKINKSRKFTKKHRFVLNSLSHYKFKEHLKHKCKEYNCEFQTVTEEYTSKCCSQCGILSDTYKYRTKMCPYCGYTCDRDINGSRNILLKNHKNNIKTLWCDKIKASGRAFHIGIMSGYNLI
jgi:surface protein